MWRWGGSVRSWILNQVGFWCFSTIHFVALVFTQEFFCSNFTNQHFENWKYFVSWPFTLHYELNSLRSRIIIYVQLFHESQWGKSSIWCHNAVCYKETKDIKNQWLWHQVEFLPPMVQLLQTLCRFIWKVRKSWPLHQRSWPALRISAYQSY